MPDFKPNIYPIMYWGLMYGLVAGFVLFMIFMLSQYITVVWFPVFLAGVIWGGYRNYRKQKQVWQQGLGLPSGEASQPATKQGAGEEFKEAARDIVAATRDMMAEQPLEPEPRGRRPEQPEEPESDQSRSN